MSGRIRLPKYCFHKPTGQAYVRFNGQFHHLGVYDSPESRNRYRDLIEAWQLRVDRSRPLELSIGEFCLLYLEHARDYYRQDGRPTSEIACIEAMIRFLMPYRRERAVDFEIEVRLRRFGRREACLLALAS